MASERTISANGIELFVREKGEGPLVVLWPELSYSWRSLLGGRWIVRTGRCDVRETRQGIFERRAG